MQARAHLVLILLGLVAMGLAGWWYYAPDSLPRWMTRSVLPSEPPPLYKWRDDRGRLHVTDRPPEGRPYETVRYDPKTNVVPSPAQ